MDPYLENPALWPDLHDSLIASIRDALVPTLRPRYYVSLEKRMYLLKPDDVAFIGRPDVAVISRAPPGESPLEPSPQTTILEVEVPMNDEVGELFLEVHDASSGQIVTVLELLSPVNKINAKGRREYEEKRDQIFASRTNLVEVDLLRAGLPMAVIGKPVRSDYRLLVSRGDRRPRAQLYAFGVRQPIPRFPLPLLKGDAEPLLDLNGIVHDLYDRAGFDLQIDHARPPVPALSEADDSWARGLVEAWKGAQQ